MAQKSLIPLSLGTLLLLAVSQAPRLFGGGIAHAQDMSGELPLDAAVVDILVAGDEWAWGSESACDTERVTFGVEQRFRTYLYQAGTWDEEGPAMEANTFTVEAGTLTYSFSHEYYDEVFETSTILHFEGRLELVAVSPDRIDGINLEGNPRSLFNCPFSVLPIMD